MKRIFSLVLAAGILGLWPLDLRPAEGQRIGFLFNLGFMTKSGASPYWLTLGPELIIPLGTGLSLNPEVTLWGSNFGFSNYYVVPGVLISFRTGRFSVGAGVVRRFWFSNYPSSDSTESISPKIQVGYGSRNSRIALIVIPLSSQDFVSFGVALGVGF